jgi:hypothetical protein
MQAPALAFEPAAAAAAAAAPKWNGLNEGSLRQVVFLFHTTMLLMSHVTRHTSHVARHVTRHTSHVTRHTSHVTRHTSHVTHRQ